MASLLRALGRISLAAIFITSGFDLARHPEARAQKAAEELPGLPEPELLARAQGAVMTAAGTALALNITRRLAAAVLALSLIPVTRIGHPFWKLDDQQARRAQKIHFLKNLAMFGGLVLVALEGGSSESRREQRRRKNRTSQVV